MTAPYLISNMRIGLDRSVEPWLLIEDAFPNMQDCYLFRGRVQRRRGFTDLGRIVTFVDNEAKGDVVTPWTSFSATLTNPDISPGSVIITVGGITLTDAGNAFGSQTGTLATSPASNNTGTINYITGAFTLTFNPALGIDTAVTVDYEYYPHDPVMGLRTREINVINQEQLIGFDTAKANNFSNANQRFVDNTFYKTTGTAFSWTGGNSDFFWTVNYANAFWATNGVKGFQSTVDATIPGAGDGIRWYDGTGWINFLPQVDSTNFLMGSVLMVTYRNRLVMLNTTEGTAIGSFTQYYQRARWSQNGTPYYVAPVPAGFTGGTNTSAWRSDQVGRGGFIDAPTSEQIISADFVKDTLVVFFERSTWQLRYTGNETLPFIWERINVELGGESTFSIVPFDKGVLAVGNYGIVSCDSIEVNRIDQIIPDEVFNIHNGNDGVKRVHGIRDYTQQLVYWTFPDASTNPTYPNKVLLYNYLDGSYAFFNDSFTCFGTYQPFNDLTWADLRVAWQQWPHPWDSGEFQSDYPLIVAGNQQGFVFQKINRGPIMNDYSLIITAATQAAPCIITSPSHNLSENTIIEIANVNGMTQLNGNKYRVSTPITANTFAIQTLEVDPNDPTIFNWVNVDSSAFGAYTNGGRIKVRNNFILLTKRFNPFIKSGGQVRLQQLDLFVETSEELQFSVVVYLDENDNSSLEQDIIIPFSNFSGKTWIRSYFSVIGQFVQLQFTFAPEQIIDPELSDGDVTIHALMPWMSTGGRLTYGEIF